MSQFGVGDRVDLGAFPTPVEERPTLGDAIDVPNLLVKHDGRTNTTYGGNKVRKLEFLLSDARQRGCSRVFTSGGIGSNHVLATAVHARSVDLEPVAVQFPQPVTDHVSENLRALARYDPDLHLLGSELWLPLSLIRWRLRARFDESLYYMPPGGSSPVGALGFVAAAAELVDQIESGACPRPDVIVVPASSGGTLAGLVVGFAREEVDIRVVGVPVTEWYVLNRLTVARLANKVCDRLGQQVTIGHDDIELCRGYLGDGYAEPTSAGDRMLEIAQAHGLTLDPTYTAKTLAGIADTFSDETVLYWHTLSDARPAPLAPAAARDRLPAAYGKFLDVAE